MKAQPHFRIRFTSTREKRHSCWNVGVGVCMHMAEVSEFVSTSMKKLVLITNNC